MQYFYTLVVLFLFYSFFGWIMEVICSLYQYHKFINRGFLIGPICPIYGVGGLLILLLLERYENDPIILFFMSIIICSVLEYFTSYIMEKIFKNRWWDYSYYKFNINGRICLECAIPFGIIALLMIYLVNPFIFDLCSKLSLEVLQFISCTFILLSSIDFVISFNVILNLKNISANIKSDSTEKITNKVKETLKSKKFPYRRLLESFPDMVVFNRVSELKDKLKNEKKKRK